MNYLYDETFEGFLTCVYHHWYTEKAEGIFTERIYQLDLTRHAMTLKTDGDKAARVLDAITEKISKWDTQRVYRVFCSNEPEKEMKLLRYIALGFKRGSRIRLLHGDPIVKAVEAAEQRVGAETHRLLGLIRFSEVQNRDGQFLLYAKVEPDNDVLEFFADHFSDRFKSEPFIIHDLRRGKALLAYDRKWDIAKLPADALRSGDYGAGMDADSDTLYHDDTDIETMCPYGGDIVEAEANSQAYSENTVTKPSFEISADEQGYSALWKQYFEAMATRERINPKCQRRFMPTRYWKHLTELGG